MANRVYINNQDNPPNVIKVDGQCYQYNRSVGSTNGEPVQAAEFNFDSCSDCQGGLVCPDGFPPCIVVSGFGTNPTVQEVNGTYLRTGTCDNCEWTINDGSGHKLYRQEGGDQVIEHASLGVVYNAGPQGSCQDPTTLSYLTAGSGDAPIGTVTSC